MSYSFFINRPVLSSVISIIIVTVGLLALQSLPVTQYPKMTPPTISVSASYSGASAETLAQTVAAPIEQELNGVEGLLYMKSSSSAEGTMSIGLTFDSNVDLDKTVVEVNNRVQRIVKSLPDAVQRAGVRVSKHSSDILGIVALGSTDKSYNKNYVCNYALLNIVDELKRLEGVGDADVMGRVNYSMRIWLYPDKLARYKLTPSDVLSRVKEQNSQYAIGHFGAPPDANMGAYTYSATARGRLTSKQEFDNIILRSDAKGAVVKLKDVARVELGAEQYSVNTKLDGHDTVPIMINLQSGANALETMERVQAKMKELSNHFPKFIKYTIAYDTTKFIKISIEEVIFTFVEALLLVILVVYIFLQNWRATLIPVVTVPISIIGTFAGMYMLGFSINLLTLFGLVLAIGIVVDDAIIVLENVERIMHEEGLSPKEAAIKSMSQVMAPVIAVVLVLCAVFIPVSFIGGMAGTMYKQFAITIAISVVVSGVVALTLTPTLCVMILDIEHKSSNIVFRNFNLAFDKAAKYYETGVKFFLHNTKIGLSIFALICALAVTLFEVLPHSLVPNEDQGSLMGFAMLPPASGLNSTLKVMDQAQKIYNSNPAIDHVISISGLDLFSGGLKSSAGAFFISLKDWSSRAGNKLQDARNLPSVLVRQTMSIEDGFVMTVNPPPIPGLSTTGGLEFYLQSHSGNSVKELYDTAQQFMTAASKLPCVASIRSTFNPNVPQYQIDVDRQKAVAMGVPINTIYDTMSATFGVVYINDFTLYGQNYKVQLQSDANFRRTPNDLSKVFVRSNSGSMIPLSVLVSAKRIVDSDQLERYNGFYAMRVMVQPAAGHSTGDVIRALEQLATTDLSNKYQIAWTGSAYQEIQAGSASSIAFVAGILMVFLILAAQYENWTLPIVVILSLPFSIAGALMFSYLRGLSNDVYFQIGLVTLIGLSAKNAILIVEFAMKEYKNGLSIVDAALSAAKMRFRPIIMTSVVFILGTLPLALSTGAGAESRHSIGTGVIGGMVFSAFIAVYFVPLFYKLVISLVTRRKEKKHY